MKWRLCIIEIDYYIKNNLFNFYVLCTSFLYISNLAIEFFFVFLLTWFSVCFSLTIASIYELKIVPRCQSLEAFFSICQPGEIRRHRWLRILFNFKSILRCECCVSCTLAHVGKAYCLGRVLLFEMIARAAQIAMNRSYTWSHLRQSCIARGRFVCIFYFDVAVENGAGFIIRCLQGYYFFFLLNQINQIITS